MTRKEQVDKAMSWLELEGDGKKYKEYKIKAIRNSKIYVKKSDRGHLLGLYYLIL